MEIKPIRTDADHQAALREIEVHWGAPDGSREGDRLEVLAILVDAYESGRWPLDRQSPREVLDFAIAETGRTQSALADILGSRSQASDILTGRRRVSLGAARKISEAWKIPIQLLIERDVVRSGRAKVDEPVKRPPRRRRVAA